MTSDFLSPFLTYLPTHVRFCLNKWVLFYLVVSDFRKPTYLPKNRMSYVDSPQFYLRKLQSITLDVIQLILDIKTKNVYLMKRKDFRVQNIGHWSSSSSPPPIFYPKLAFFAVTALLLLNISIAQHQHWHCLALALLSISIAQHQHCLALALLSISIAQHQLCLALVLLSIGITHHQHY